MPNYDPRKISLEVYTQLKQVKEGTTDPKLHDEQRNQAIELYTYIATWGLMRLKGEEPALVNKPQKQKVIQRFFKALGSLVHPTVTPNPLEGAYGLETLTKLQASEYLGLTGVALQVAREFSFWAESLYARSNSSNNQTGNG